MRDTTYVDSKAFLVQLIFRIPYLLLIAVTGAILGSGLYLLITTINTRTPVYENETRYYINFNENKFDAPSYYNDYTWEHEILRSDIVLGRVMTILGSGYSREDVASMISARVLADVRFLTITIKGQEKNEIEKISSAINQALIMLVTDDTITDISKIIQIENTGVNKKEVSYFTWRAALLGALLFLITAVFCETIKFAIGTRFYTKSDIANKLNLAPLAIFFKNKENEIEIRHMEIHLEHMGYAKEDIRLVNYYEDLVSTGYSEMRSKKGVVLLIPSGVDALPRVTETLQNLKIQDIKVVGAVLTDVNKSWYKLYMTGIKHE